MRVKKKRLGDRYDGKLIRSLNPFYRIIPYIMPTRISAQVFFDDSLDADILDAYIREKRKNGLKGFGFLHVLLTAIVRTLSQHPKLNRFVAGQKIYARNSIDISFVVKKKLSGDAAETTVKLNFSPFDTVYEVFDKLNKEISINKDEENENKADNTAKLLMLCPGFLIKFSIYLIKILDNNGLLPKSLNRISPLHTSVFVTNVASLGIQPIYHHLYEIGTASIFLAFGAKQKREGSEGKFIPIKLVGDERIADGFAFASGLKYFMSLLKHPERLDIKPENVVEDVK